MGSVQCWEQPWQPNLKNDFFSMIYGERVSEKIIILLESFLHFHKTHTKCYIELFKRQYLHGSHDPMMCAVKNSARAAKPHDVCSGLQGTSCFQGGHLLVENWALRFCPLPRGKTTIPWLQGQACSHSFSLIHTGIIEHPPHHSYETFQVKQELREEDCLKK